MRFPLLLMTVVTSLALLSANKRPLHSSHSLIVKQLASGHGEFDFNIQTDILMNFEAPWQIKIIDSGAVTFAPTTLKADQLVKVYQDEPSKMKDWSKQAHFKLTTSEKLVPNQKGTLSYQIDAYVCTEAKGKCYRDIHLVKDAAWQVSP